MMLFLLVALVLCYRPAICAQPTYYSICVASILPTHLQVYESVVKELGVRREDSHRAC